MNSKNISVGEDIKPNEGYTETIAILLYILFVSEPFEKRRLVENFKKELLFALYQTAKLFVYEKFRNASSIRQNSEARGFFRQEVANFEYYYLKSKLLVNLSGLFTFNDTPPTNSDRPYLNLKFPRGKYLEFEPLLSSTDAEFDTTITNLMALPLTDKTILLNILDFV